jgi:hypothetical protein
MTEEHNPYWMGDPTCTRDESLPTLQIMVDYFKERGIPLENVQLTQNQSRELNLIITKDIS